MLTEEEENILRLIIKELRSRKKVDLERQAIDAEIRASWNTIHAQINEEHQAVLTSLEINHKAAEDEITAACA